MDVAKYLSRQFADRADEADRQGKLPAKDVQALKDSGYLSLSVPKRYGGLGLSLKECIAAHLELAQGSASTAMVAGMQMHIFGYASEADLWSEEMLAKLCQQAVNGGLFNFVASEPQLGSPSRGGAFQTRAVPATNGDGWVINGHKTWSTGGVHLTHLLVRVSIEADPAVILVYQNTLGVSWVETWSDSLSLRASDSHDVYFNNVVVARDHLIEWRKREKKTSSNAWFPLVMASVYLGTAIAARNTVIQFALERVPTSLGKPIATLPSIQRQIGEIDLALQAAQSLLFQVASEWSGNGTNSIRLPSRIAAAKHLATETANDVTDKALRIAGGVSLTKALALERYFRDVRAGSMQPPAGDTALEIIGRSAIDRVKIGK